jgi:hypothetical protein
MLTLPMGAGWMSYALNFQYVSGSNWAATRSAPITLDATTSAWYATQVANYKADLTSANPTVPSPIAAPQTYSKYYSERGAYHQNDQYNLDLVVAMELPLTKRVRFFSQMKVINVLNHIYQQTYDTTTYNGTGKVLNLDPTVFGGTRAGTADEAGYYSGPRQVSFSTGLKF